MLKVDGWYFPNGESHLPAWMANAKVRMRLNGRSAYQGQKQEAALALCKKHRVAIDVGSHVGLWSFNLAHSFDKVEAFEPVAAHRECFEHNLLGCDNVTLHACALGEIAGSISMRTEPTSSGDSRVAGPGNIPMYTLDSFDFQNVDLLKIDTEGHELFVLKGATEMLVQNHPVVVVEQKPGHARRYGVGDTEAIPFLESLGAKLRREMAGDYFLTWD